MRLAILDHGHGIRTKAMFVLIRVFSGHPVVDAVKLALYRPSFYRGGGLTPGGDARTIGMVGR